MRFQRVILSLLLFNTATSVLIDQTGLHKNLLEGKILTVVAGHFPPSTILIKSDNGTTISYEGLLFEYLNWLSQYYKFKYQIIELEENVKGMYNRDEEEWTGMIAYLVNNTADLALAKFGATIKRTAGMEFAGFIDGDNTALLVKYPVAVISYFGVLEPFTQTVWILLLLGSVSVIIVTWSIVRIRAKHITEDHLPPSSMNSFSDVALYFMSITFSEGVFKTRGLLWTGIVMPTTWCLVSFVIVNSYTSTLTSFLSLQTRKPEINSFKDLAKSNQYKILIGPGTISHIDMLNAKNGSLKIVGDKIRTCSHCLIDSWEDMAKGVKEEFHDTESAKYVGIGMTGPLHQMIQNDFTEKRECRMTMAKEELNWKPMFLGLPVNSLHLNEISYATIWWHEMGLNSYWKQRQGYPKQCLLNYGSKGKASEIIPSAITLNSVSIAFFILIIGYSIAFLVLIAEIAYKSLHGSCSNFEPQSSSTN